MRNIPFLQRQTWLNGPNADFCYLALASTLLGVLVQTSTSNGVVGAIIPVYSYVVKQAYPHDRLAFTQGLLIKDSVLYESTGLRGHSSIRRVELETGRVLDKKEMPSEIFGEGIAAVGNEIFCATWTSRVGFIYNAKTFEMKRNFRYEGEGWGLTSHGTELFMSDGSPAIRVMDATTLAVIRRIHVTADGRPLHNLNELEWVDGEIYANIWHSNVIARINPVNGSVVGWIDLSGLADPAWKGIGSDDVLNGIAWDVRHRRLFVTGKHWPKLYEIELVERADHR